MAAETETTTAAGALPAHQMRLNAPESIDVAQAVGLMDDLTPGDGDAGNDDRGDEREAEAAAAADEGEDTAEDGEGETAEDETAEDGEGEDEEQPEAVADDAPEFWSAEDKLAWTTVPAGLRPLLKKYEGQRLEFVNEKAREAAYVRRQAIEEVQRAHASADQTAQWWRENGPALQQAFADKWSQTNWKELAEKDPAEYARLNEKRLEQQAVLAEADRRGQAEIKAATERAERALQEARGAENAKLAHRLPDYFGTPETLHKTFDEIGKFLFAKGIPADRIAAIYEAPIIELALSAMRFEQAQKLAQRSREGGKAGKTPARPTPTRVAPGPAHRAGNRTADAARQAGERFRKSGGSSIADAAELIRLSGL